MRATDTLALTMTSARNWIAAGLFAIAGTAGAGEWPVYAPPPGRVLVSLVQPHSETPDSGMWRGAPAAVTAYTNLRNLAGVETPFDAGSGVTHVDGMMQRFPHSALIIGLFMRGQLEETVGGRLDAQIDRLINVTAGYRRPVYLRFGYEFDRPGNRYDPELYKAAWRHLWNRLRERDARHITLVWHASGACADSNGVRPLSDWYPGDDAVQWVGVSYFHPTECGGVLADGVVAFARQHGKPVMVAEAAPRGYDLEGGRYSNDGVDFSDKSPGDMWREWFEPFFDFVRRNRPEVRMVTYISQNWDSYPMWSRPGGVPYRYWGDSRLGLNPTVAHLWRRATLGKEWAWGNDRLFAQLGFLVDETPREQGVP